MTNLARRSPTGGAGGDPLARQILPAPPAAQLPFTSAGFGGESA